MDPELPQRRDADPPAPVTTVVISGTGAGDGKQIPNNTVATTPDHLPNVVITIVSPLMALAVRVIGVFLNTLLGLITAGMTTQIIPAKDFGELLVKCASLSIAAAGVCLIQNLVTMFGKLEAKFPLLRA